ncbi:hypothetical protein [Saccharopolyspora taberi]|uniref:Uncharacterized protein n=1 Tax=Saccharopolyspora taberi TaxID=60895 RepID=A0ABN3VMU7_9PSEU
MGEFLDELVSVLSPEDKSWLQAQSPEVQESIAKMYEQEVSLPYTTDAASAFFGDPMQHQKNVAAGVMSINKIAYSVGREAESGQGESPTPPVDSEKMDKVLGNLIKALKESKEGRFKMPPVEQMTERQLVVKETLDAWSQNSGGLGEVMAADFAKFTDWDNLSNDDYYGRVLSDLNQVTVKLANRATEVEEKKLLAKINNDAVAMGKGDSSPENSTLGQFKQIIDIFL